MKSRAFACATALAISCYGFSFTLVDNGGTRTWDNGLGSTATATLEYFDTDSTAWSFVEAFFTGNGFTVNNGGDLSGTLTANDFSVADYGVNGVDPVVGLSWDFSTDEDDTSDFNTIENLTYGILDEVTLTPGGNFTGSEYNPYYNPADPNYSLDFVNPSWAPTSVLGNYGWVLSTPVHQLSERYLFFAHVDTSGQEITLYDGVKMTLDADLVPTAAVPEPFTMALAGGGLLVALRRRRK